MMRPPVGPRLHCYIGVANVIECYRLAILMALPRKERAVGEGVADRTGLTTGAAPLRVRKVVSR